MADDGTIEIEFVVKDEALKKSLDSIEKEADATAAKTKKTVFIDFQELKKEGSDAFEDLTGNIGKFGVAAAVVGGTLMALKSSFDFALQGEQIEAIHRQFGNLATSAGLAPAALREGLEKAADKLVSMEKILTTANSAIINLGSSAERLPQILELARKVTSLYGGNIEERFNGIVSAIESGNVKALKSQGIIVDADKAWKEYANTLGLTTSELNQGQKQQAVMNAVLAEGANKFANVDSSIQPVKDNLLRINSAISDIGDSIKKAVANSGVFQLLTESLVTLARGAPEIKNTLTTEVADLIAQRANLQQKILNLSKNLGVNPDHTREVIGELKARIASINSEIAKSGMVVTQNSSEMVAEAKKALAAESQLTDGKAATLDIAQKAAIRMRELALEQASLQDKLAENSSGQNSTSLLTTDLDRRAALLQLYNERELLQKQALDNQMAQLEQQRIAGAIQTETDLQTRILQVRTQYGNQAAQLDLERRKALMEYTATAVDGISGFQAAFAGFEEVLQAASGAAKDFAISSAANFRSVGKQMFNSIGSGAAQAFSAFGKAMVTGGNALEAFANSLLSTMGQMAVQLGTQFILQGAAYMWAGMKNGGALMAAGAALAAFGGILSGLSGGGGATASSSSSGGGIASTEQSEAAKIIEPDKLERKAPDTTVNFNGPILGDEQSARYITDLLNEWGAKNGLKLVGLT